MLGTTDRTSARRRGTEVSTCGKRRRWTTEQKHKIVAEGMEPDVSVAMVARQHGISTGQFYAWRQQLLLRRALDTGADSVPNLAGIDAATSAPRVEPAFPAPGAAIPQTEGGLIQRGRVGRAGEGHGHGAKLILLGEVAERTEMIDIRCWHCDRHGHYRTARLVAPTSRLPTCWTSLPPTAGSGSSRIGMIGARPIARICRACSRRASACWSAADPARIPSPPARSLATADPRPLGPSRGRSRRAGSASGDRRPREPLAGFLRLGKCASRRSTSGAPARYDGKC